MPGKVLCQLGLDADNAGMPAKQHVQVGRAAPTQSRRTLSFKLKALERTRFQQVEIGATSSEWCKCVDGQG